MKNNLDQNITNQKADNIKDNAKSTPKRKLMIVIWVLVGAILFLFIASWLIDIYYVKKAQKEAEAVKFNFYPADYEEDIFEDERYLALIDNGFIYYTDHATNLTVGIERDNAETQGEEVKFMVEYIYSIINGDSEGYNNFFSEKYFSENERKDVFTMQKLYDVNITKELPTNVSDKNSSYTQYVFILEYRILENNGTFRDDFLDGKRKQYITVTDREGRLLIDSISVSKTKK